MKYTGILFCLAATVLAVKAVSVSGQAGIDRNSVFAGGKLTFPRIPGFNEPLSSLFPTRRTTTTIKPNGSSGSTSTTGSTSPSSGGSNPFNLPSLFDIPDPSSLIPDLSSLANISGGEVPPIPGLPDLSQLPAIPGLSKAIQSARDHVKTALQLGDDVSSGLQLAVQEALDSSDPTNAVRTIVKTIIDAYMVVATNCPLMVIGSRVLQEGIRLVFEVARAVTNIILGTTSSPN